MPQNKSDKKASLIASIFLWHQSLIDLVTLGRTIDFYVPSFPHETEGDGLIFFFNIPCEPSTRPYLAGIICRITVSLFSNMTYILAETKPCPRSTLGGFQGNWCYSFFPSYCTRLRGFITPNLFKELYAIYCGKSIMCNKRNLIQQTGILNNSYLH